jgi:cytochrome c553
MTVRLLSVCALAVLLAACGGTAAPASVAPVSGAQSAGAKPPASSAPKPAASAAAKPSVAGKPAASAAAEGAAPASPPPGSAEHGKEVYVKVGCYECHGYAGQGAQATGPKLTPSPLPYVAFAAQVRTPRQDMPKYPVQTLSEQDLADIYAFIQSIPAPPAPSSIPLLTNR